MKNFERISSWVQLVTAAAIILFTVVAIVRSSLANVFYIIYIQMLGIGCWLAWYSISELAKGGHNDER